MNKLEKLTQYLNELESESLKNTEAIEDDNRISEERYLYCEEKAIQDTISLIRKRIEEIY